MEQLKNLPENITRCLESFIDDAKSAFGEELLSIVLFGSAAEGRLRPTSDINLILILKKFNKEKVDKIRDSFRTAHAAIKLEAMFILEDELSLAIESFAVKFSDIESRHVVLFGKDCFSGLAILPDAIKLRLRQVLTNQILRLRENYILTSLREEQLTKIIADVAGPIRSSAAAILKLQAVEFSNPKEALNQIVRKNFTDAKWEEVLSGITKARESVSLPKGKPERIYFSILELTEFLLKEVTRLG